MFYLHCSLIYVFWITLLSNTSNYYIIWLVILALIVLSLHWDPDLGSWILDLGSWGGPDKLIWTEASVEACEVGLHSPTQAALTPILIDLGPCSSL